MDSTLSPALRTRQLSKTVRLYLFLAVLVGLALAVYTTERSLQFMDKLDIIGKFEALSTELDNTKVQENGELNDLSKKYTDRKSSLAIQLVDIFPPQEQYTELTRTLDKFFKDTNSPLNPIFASDLRFGASRSDQTTQQYDVLPFSMTINASEENFYKFLEYVQNSGSLTGKIRLMDLQSFNMNLPAEKNGQINFKVDMNAYFQKSSGKKPS